MRVLVLGSSGFLGRLTVRALAARGHAVEGWSRTGAESAAGVLERRVDLAEPSALPRRAGPWDAALLLASPSVPARFTDPAVRARSMRIAANALSLLARVAPGARVVLASSAHVLAPSAQPLGEDAATAPHGPYGAAKLEAERLALAREGQLDVRIARLFGSLGPGLPAELFVPDLVTRLTAPGPGRPQPIGMAGPDALRDLTDGRDVAAALVALLEDAGTHGAVFHVGTGRGVRLSEVADGLARRLGHAGGITFAPGEGPCWIAASARLRAATGWTPARGLEESLDWVAEAARAAQA